MAHQLFSLPKQTAISANLTLLPGAKVEFFLTTTTTPTPVYTTSALSTPHANPVVADSAGRLPPIYLDPSIVYRITFKDSAGAEIYPAVDPVNDQLLSQAIIGAYLYPRTAAEIAALVTPVNYAYPPQVPMLKRYGAAGDSAGTASSGTDDTVEIAQAASLAPAGQIFDGGGLSYRVSSTLPASPIPAGFNLFNGEVVSDEMITTQDEYSVTVSGFKALLANTYIPEQHAASGGRFFASGNHLVAIGREAMKANTTGRRNVAVGSRSMLANTTGYYNTCIGSHTFEVGTTGFENTCVGVQSLQRAVNAEGNAMCGLGAGLGITSGSYNVGIGWGAVGGVNGGASVTTGNYNAGGGYRALYFITTGTDNAAWGRDSLVSLTTGSNNTSIGSSTLTAITSEGNNTAVGYNALRSATSAANTAVGNEAADAITTGTGAAVVGHQAATAATTADYATALGFQALSAVTTGNNNTGVGRAAGLTITTGTNNVCIGYGTDVSAVGATNQNSIGYNAACTGDNQFTMGNASIATLRCQQTTITALSDARFKKNIQKLAIPDEALNEIEIVVFEWLDEGMPQGPQVGVIAQELDEWQEKWGVQWLGLVDKTNPERWEATPGKLLFLLIPAFQRLSERVAKLEGNASFMR